MVSIDLGCFLHVLSAWPRELLIESQDGPRPSDLMTSDLPEVCLLEYPFCSVTASGLKIVPPCLGGFCIFSHLDSLFQKYLQFSFGPCFFTDL